MNETNRVPVLTGREQRENRLGLEAGCQEQLGTDRTGYQAERTGCCSE